MRHVCRCLLLLLLLCLLATPASAGPNDGKLISLTPAGHSGAVNIYQTSYWSDGLRVKGKLFWPTGPAFPAPPGARPTAARPLPVVMFNHDGVSGISSWTARRAVELAAEGYIVFAPSFRGEDGSEGTIEIARGEINDVLNAVTMVGRLKGADTTRVAAVGMSHGALISVLAAERSNAFRCVVEAYGVMDIFKWWTWLKTHGFRTDDAISLRVYGKGPTDRPHAFHVRNAVEHLAGLKVPLLILQGTIDKTVPPEQANFMQQACKKLGKQCEMHLYPGAQHGFLIYGGSEKSDPPGEVNGQKAAWKAMLAFLKRWL